MIAVAAERGALADRHLTLIIEALTPDGAARFRREGGVMLPEDGAEAAAQALGRELGDAMRLEGGRLAQAPGTVRKGPKRTESHQYAGHQADEYV